MHNQIPRPQGDLLLSKDPHNTHRIVDWVQKQEEAPNLIIEAKVNPMQIPNLSKSGEGLSESPPSSSPSTPSSDSTEWEQLSTTATEQSTLSTQFEVLKGYHRVPIYERRAQWLAEQRARREQKLQTSPRGTSYSSSTAFQPNSQLPFPITAQFLRSYGGSNGISWEGRRLPQSDDSQRTVLAPPNNLYTLETTASYNSTPISSPSSPENVPDSSSFTQDHELTKKKRARPDPPSRKTSGIPSFTSLFESRWSWDPNSKSRGSDHSATIAGGLSTHAFPGIDLEHKTKLEIVLPECENKTISRLGYVLGLRRMAFLALLISSSLGLTVFSVLAAPYFASVENTCFAPAHGSYTTSPHIHPSYVDFLTLMSIETSLEKIVESATGGSALARLLKQGEIVVNDLGTVVKHSGLNCKKTLGEQLDHFATDAREGVNALQLFETKVGEVLDQLLGANQDFLGEFTGQLKRQRRLRYTSIPFISKSTNNTHTLIQLSENYSRAARLLESNLRILITAGKSIIESLDSLCQQHNPIYEEIVREFVNIERQEGTPWTRIGWEGSGASVLRKMKLRESKALLVSIGSYEEKARGYVENIRLELESMVGEMKNLQRRVSRSLANLNRVTSDTRTNGAAGISLERQLEAVEETVAAMLRKRTQRTRRNTACYLNLMENRPRINETEIYRNTLTPTRTSST